MVVAKRQGSEKPVKIEQRKVQGPQVKQTDPWLAQFTQGRFMGRRKNIFKKKEPKLSQGLLFSSCLLGRPVLMPQGCIFLCLPIKLSYNTGPSVASNFCCGERELKKLQTPPQQNYRCIPGKQGNSSAPVTPFIFLQ